MSKDRDREVAMFTMVGILYELFDIQTAKKWWGVSNPMLQGKTPREFLEEDKNNIFILLNHLQAVGR